MKYQVIMNSNIIDLIDKVNSFISMGWKPLGGIAFDITGNTTYLQAMVKENA